MMSVVPELFLWDQSVNISCSGRMECDALYELGPPPDMILNIPPPPVPPFMEEFISRLASEGINVHEEPSNEFSQDEKHCNLCNWANSNGVGGFVELPQKGPVIDDTWFMVIISSCIAGTLLAIILVIAGLKYREGKLKPLSDVALAKKEKALGLERCEAVLYPAPSLTPVGAPPDPHSATRALWAGLKPLEGNHYTVDHCQPMDQKPRRLDLIPTSDNTYDYADYTAINYTTTLAPNYAPLPENNQVIENTISPRPTPIMTRPAPAASFENVGYVPSDENLEVNRTIPNGCAVTRAAYLLGSQYPITAQAHHHYEMVTPKSTPSPRRHQSLDRNGINRNTPVISAPTGVSAAWLPPLNSRQGKYNLTALVNGSHTLTPKIENSLRAAERRLAHVSLDRGGNTNTSLAPASPADHIYASPITSPVI